MGLTLQSVAVSSAFRAAFVASKPSTRGFAPEPEFLRFRTDPDPSSDVVRGLSTPVKVATPDLVNTIWFDW